jgi:hypothetical protein
MNPCLNIYVSCRFNGAILNETEKNKMNQMKWVVAFGVLSLAACSKTQPVPSTASATTAAAASPPAASTNTAAATPDIAKIQCKKGKETRLLEVTKKDTGYLLYY